jgi:hypothetical protein
MHVWERGLSYTTIDRALVVLEAACPDMSREAIAKLSIGERDSRLLILRQWLFGNQINSASNCPHCQELMEWSTSTDTLRLQPLELGTSAKNLLITHQDFHVEFRLPNTLDLVAISEIDEVATARQTMLERCISKLERKGKPVTLSRLPQRLIQKILTKMEQADPQADLRIELVCANCQHKWEATFDIVAFLWAEIQSWAKQTLRAVHILARAYGWREQDILSMSPLRRQLYLEMAGY